MKSQRGCGLIGWLVAAFAMFAMLGGMTATAAVNPGSQVSVSLAAGQSYVINHINTDSTPAVKIIDNPHALIVHESAGKMVLLGAGKGHWAINVKLADGTPAIYDVRVRQLADAKNPLAPVAASPAPDAGVGPLDAKADAKTPSDKTPSDTAANAAPVAHAPAKLVEAKAETPKVVQEVAPVSAPKPAAPVQQVRTADNEAVIGAAPMPEQANPIISSQAASQAAQIPTHKFKSDPLASDFDNDELDSGTAHYLPANGILLRADTSKLLNFPCRLRRVSIADTKISDIQVVNPHQINLVAHHPGFTTLTIWDDQGHYEQSLVRVDKNGRQQVLLNVTVAELDRNRIENQGVNLSTAFTHLGLSLVGLPGAVAAPYNLQSGQQAKVTSMTPAGSLMPLLLSNNLTYGLAAGNSAVQTQTFFQFLEEHDLGRVLAEPHLLANSGEKAQFLSGGEIPIVISQALNTSIVFKKFGTSVSFIPTVVGRNMIELEVRPEVSQPDYAHGVQLFGFTVPAFVTREAHTNVRLRNNQTLIIAGLIVNTPTSTIDKVPYLGDVPVLGGLFRHTNYQNQQSELVMSVTPQIVSPLPSYAQVSLPTSRPPLSEEDIRTRTLTPPNAARPRL